MSGQSHTLHTRYDTTARDDCVVMDNGNDENNRIMQRTMSDVTFNTLGSGYTLPTRDHDYKTKFGLKFGDFGHKPPPSGYMHNIIKRAKSSVDPRKYAS